MGGYQSGQMGQTVTLLSQDFEGSNPSPPTYAFKAIPKMDGFIPGKTD